MDLSLAVVNQVRDYKRAVKPVKVAPAASLFLDVEGNVRYRRRTCKRQGAVEQADGGIPETGVARLAAQMRESGR
jgi:hypothetical protein